MRCDCPKERALECLAKFWASKKSLLKSLLLHRKLFDKTGKGNTLHWNSLLLCNYSHCMRTAHPSLRFGKSEE